VDQPGRRLPHHPIRGGTSGKWTLTIGTVEQLATKAPSGRASGRGDDVIVLGGSASTARIKHSKGQSNFVVHAYNLDTGKSGLLVNEVGGYAGTRPLEAPASVQVTADGVWSINIDSSSKQGRLSIAHQPATLRK